MAGNQQDKEQVLMGEDMGEDENPMDSFDLHSAGIKLPRKTNAGETAGETTTVQEIDELSALMEQVIGAPESRGAEGGAHNVPATSYTQPPLRNPTTIKPLDRTAMVQRRGGRMPSLMRFEVEMIRADSRNVTDAAKHYGVSENTIRRVREIGCFAGVPYIPADEYDNTVTITGVGASSRATYNQSPMSEFVHGPLDNTGRKFGRPYPNRSKPFSDAELYDIASNAGTSELAEKYGVSRSTIYNIKRKMSAMLPQGQSLIDVALNDPRPSSMLARQYGPYYHVNAGWFDHVRQYGEPPQPRDPSLPRGTTAENFPKGAVTPEGNNSDTEGDL